MIEEKCDLYVKNYIKATTGEETAPMKEEIAKLESKKDKYIELATDGLMDMEEAKKKVFWKAFLSATQRALAL